MLSFVTFLNFQSNPKSNDLVNASSEIAYTML